jgi:alpha-glucosidase
MHEANVTGLPVMRPLFLEFPDDVQCYRDENLTFMFGSSVLIANVLEKSATERTIYLPSGTVWYDMNDNMRAYDGGQTISIPVKLSSIPMFLRGNGIFFTSNDVKRIMTDTMRQLDIVIGCEGESSMTFYDDDGNTEDYKKGISSRMKISVHSGDRKIISFMREGEYPSTIERMTMKIISKLKGAYWVSVDGRKIERFIVKDYYDEANEGWYYDMSDRSIKIKFNVPDKDNFDVTVSTEKFDLIGMND